jgi:Mycothiol maleylpyruvate isomerase N-terminal domain
MALDRSYVELNRASTERMRALAARLSDEELGRRCGEQWTVAIALAHLAFWDARVLVSLDWTRAAGKLSFPQIDVVVNDILLPEWAAIPPRAAAALAVETAEAIDARLEAFPSELLEEIYAYNRRWVVRALHRNDHLDEVDAALRA